MVISNSYLNKLLPEHERKYSVKDKAGLVLKGILWVVSYPILLPYFAIRTAWQDTRYDSGFIRPFSFTLSALANIALGAFVYLVGLVGSPFLLINLMIHMQWGDSIANQGKKWDGYQQQDNINPVKEKLLNRSDKDKELGKSAVTTTQNNRLFEGKKKRVRFQDETKDESSFLQERRNSSN